MPTRTAAVLTLFLGAAALAQQTATENVARVKVTLPRADAEVTIDDKPTKQTGTAREFVTPALDPNKKYVYTFKAVIKPNNYTTITRVREVSLAAGQTVELDLRKEDPDKDKIVIRYVPTPPEVVDAMLRMAKVGKDDVVYDLGCGDGRMVIAAVTRGGAKKGVGIDIDPKRIEECAAGKAALAAEAQARLEFRLGDVLDVKDLSDANVVMLYMGEEMNARLKPILQRTLKPGSRIVSHRFTMGDWKADQTETVRGEDGDDYRVLLWTVPGK